MNNITHTDSEVCISVASNRAGFCQFRGQDGSAKQSRKLRKFSSLKVSVNQLGFEFSLTYSLAGQHQNQIRKAVYRQHESQLETIEVVDLYRTEKSC